MARRPSRNAEIIYELVTAKARDLAALRTPGCPLRVKRWRRLPGQDNRENNSARFSCAHVFTQPGSIATEMGRPPYVRSAPDSDRRTDIAGGPKGANARRWLGDDIHPSRLAQRPNLT